MAITFAQLIIMAYAEFFLFIFMENLFVFLLYLNVRSGLDKLWLIYILATLAVQVILGYWTFSMLHQFVPKRDNSMIWLYISATFINVSQLGYYLIISKKRFIN
ncbi:hypothetical protein AB1A65_14405 [Muricauda sp. ANG21]|uniref:hypothetical protein n=1 Tax=Allomuricauda sp. ANG21 TaxID=3042468 RepID=UPI003455B529